MAEKFEKTYEAALENLDFIAEDIEAFCDACQVSPAVAYAFNLCTDEIFTNIVSYGYKGAEGSVELEMEKSGNSLTLKMRDTSPPFDPLTNAPEPDTTSGVEDRQIGGLGIFFLKKNMDYLNYERVGNVNILTMSKNLA